MFKISTRIRYAVRALVRLSVLSEGKEMVSLKEISRYEGIPVKYLENIMQFLKKNKIVSSSKGPGGGYKLNADIDELSLFDIVKAFEGDIYLVDCCSDTYECPKKDDCPAFNAWYEMTEVLKNRMKSIKLKDLVNNLKN